MVIFKNPFFSQNAMNGCLFLLQAKNKIRREAANNKNNFQQKQSSVSRNSSQT